jgi:hypothetical protein
MHAHPEVKPIKQVSKQHTPKKVRQCSKTVKQAKPPRRRNKKQIFEFCFMLTLGVLKRDRFCYQSICQSRIALCCAEIFS